MSDAKCPVPASTVLNELFPERLPAEQSIAEFAVGLAVTYSDPSNVPARFRPGGGQAPTKKRNATDAGIEMRFRESVVGWAQLIQTMAEKTDQDTAWRLLRSEPVVQPHVTSVTDCADFNSFVDYLILRRDTEVCGSQELGNLCALLSALEAAITRRLA